MFRESLDMRAVSSRSTGVCARRLVSHGLRGALALALIFTLPANTRSQQRTSPRFGPPDAPTNAVDPTIPMNDGTGSPDEKLLKMLNAARQSSMVSNADKLLKLARELNAEVSASKGGAPTEAQLRKVARIEKLAHSVRVEMSTVVRIDQPDQVSFPVPK